jgi:hypothetical protein
MRPPQGVRMALGGERVSMVGVAASQGECARCAGGARYLPPPSRICDTIVLPGMASSTRYAQLACDARCGRSEGAETVVVCGREGQVWVSRGSLEASAGVSS